MWKPHPGSDSVLTFCSPCFFFILRIPVRFGDLGNLELLRQKWAHPHSLAIQEGLAVTAGTWNNRRDMIFKHCLGLCFTEWLRTILSFEDDPLTIIVVLNGPLQQAAGALKALRACVGTELTSKKLCAYDGSIAFRRHSAAEQLAASVLVPHFSPWALSGAASRAQATISNGYTSAPWRATSMCRPARRITSSSRRQSMSQGLGPSRSSG